MEPQPEPAPVPATRNIIQNDPAPATPNDVQADVPRVMDGSSEELALEVMDLEDELVSDMVLTPRQEQRLRRQLQIWRDRASSDSSDQ